MLKKSVSKKFLYLLFGFPLFFHLLFWILSENYFYRHIKQEPVRFGLLNHRGTGDVELWGIYGDVFDPQAKNVDFDVVVVSTTVNPIAIIKGDLGDIIVWQQNNLLHSALENTFHDPEVFQQVIKEMVISMGENGEFIRYFLSTEFSITEEYQIKDLVHAYFWDVPNQGPFYKKTRINSIVAVPIFDPWYIYGHLMEISLVHSRLKDNVNIVIKRALSQIEQFEDQKKYSVNTIAIPALAGTCCREDSWLYLDYSTSFSTILEALESSKVPNPIDRIYLVIYDKLPTVAEEERALNGMLKIFRYYQMRYWLESKNFSIQGSMLRALIWLIPWGLIVFVTYWNDLIKSRNRLGKVQNIIGAIGIYYGLITPVNEIMLDLSKHNVLYLFLGDIFFGLLTFILFINVVHPNRNKTSRN